MKWFVSHSSKDGDFVKPILTLLKTGCGIKDSDLFCSVVPGNIRNGKEFKPQILSKLNEADAVLALLSTNYLVSNFCIAEFGVALTKTHADEGALHVLLIPPTTVYDLKGVFESVQAGRIDAPAVLDVMRDIFIGRRTSGPGTAVWNEQRDLFIDAIRDTASRRTLYVLLNERLPVFDVIPEHDVSPTIQYKSKLRVLFRNDTGASITVHKPEWVSGTHGAAIQPPDCWSWQLDNKGGWHKNDWQAETQMLLVPERRVFRTWIGLHQEYDANYMRRLHEMRKLGELKFKVAIGAVTISHIVAL